jgi:hypothetical protein
MYLYYLGKCISAFSNGKIPYCVKFNPDHPDSFLVGCSDKKIIQVSNNKLQSILILIIHDY